MDSLNSSIGQLGLVTFDYLLGKPIDKIAPEELPWTFSRCCLSGKIKHFGRKKQTWYGVCHQRTKRSTLRRGEDELRAYMDPNSPPLNTDRGIFHAWFVLFVNWIQLGCVIHDPKSRSDTYLDLLTFQHKMPVHGGVHKGLHSVHQPTRMRGPVQQSHPASKCSEWTPKRYVCHWRL